MKRSHFILLLYSALFITGATLPVRNGGIDIKSLEQSMAYIPGGEWTFRQMLNIEFEPMDTFNRKETEQVGPFYLCNHEVSNAEYLAFLSSLKTSDPLRYAEMLPDTHVWRAILFYNETLVKEYFRDEQYTNHPVVGVSHSQAQAYCQWLTDEYHKAEKRKFRQVQFSLPTEAQWCHAASGGLNLSPFPWGGPLMYDRKRRPRANFLEIPQSYIGRTTVVREHPTKQLVEQKILMVQYPYGHHNEVPTREVLAFEPNGFGLYNMGGNVSEMLDEQGLCKGGSWMDTGYYMHIDVYDVYDADRVSSSRGFRVMMEVVL